MTREEMIATLEYLVEGTLVTFDGLKHLFPGTYEVINVNKYGGKLHRCDVRLLEVGKPLREWTPGKYLNAGKWIDVDNSKHITLYAQKGDIASFQIIGEKEPLDFEKEWDIPQPE